MAIILVGTISGYIATKAGKGGLGGAAAEAAAGQAIGHNTEATLLGATIGEGMLGYTVGNEMDKADRQKVAKTYETVPNKQSREWVNPNTKARYKVTPKNTYNLNPAIGWHSAVDTGTYAMLASPLSCST